MASSSYVPSSCTVLNVIEWLPKDETQPGFVVLTFLGFFVIGAILALIIVRCAVREVEVKKPGNDSYTGHGSKKAWVYDIRVYVKIFLVLLIIFLVTLIVVQIWFATIEKDVKKRSEDRMSEGFSSSRWIWFLIAAVILLPLVGYLLLKCILFPGTFEAMRIYCKEHNERRREKKVKEHIVLVQMNQTVTTSEETSVTKRAKVFPQNRVSPVNDEDEEGTMMKENQSDNTSNACKTSMTSVPSLRSEPGSVEEKSARNSEKYGDAIIEILTKTSSEKMEVELQGQDLNSVLKMEDNILKCKGENIVNVWKMILDVLFDNGRITEVFRRECVAKLEQAVDDIHRSSNEELENETRKLKEELDDPAEFEEALERLNARRSKKINSELISLQTEAAKILKEKSNLSEEEAEAIIMKVKCNLATCERFLVEEQTRQSMVLQEKLLRRQALVQLRDQMNDQEKEMIDSSPKKHREALNKLCQDGKLLEDQKEEILSEYEQNLRKLQENHEQSILDHQNKLALKLKQKREEKIQILKLEQQRENEERYTTACRQMSQGELTLEDFVKEQADLNRKHTMEREEAEGTTDKTEAEELERVRQHLEEERDEQIKSYEAQMLKKLSSLPSLSSEDMHRFMEEHKKDMAFYNEKLEESKAQQRFQLKEKIEARKARLQRERAQQKNEQAQLITQQEEVIVQVLNMQVGLTEEMRKQVMVEHEQNLMNLNNHLQITRLRQQKRLEERLAQRKAKLADMKKSQQDKISSNAKGDPDKLQDLIKQHNKEYEDEVKKMEDEHDKALEDLRRRLSLETEEALKEQDKKLGEILGKLQVGVARRDEIIRRQNETIKTIENKLVDKMTKEGTFAENDTDKVLKQHQRQIVKLESKINEAKETQEKRMREKIEAKRLKKERDLSAKHADEVEQQRTRGVRSATRVMMSVLAEKQLKQKIENLRREMELELAKQKEELNKVMEEKLMEELELHKKNFITQLASISNMKEEEISKICKDATTESGGDQQTSKNLSKDLRKRFRSMQQDAVV